MIQFCSHNIKNCLSNVFLQVRDSGGKDAVQLDVYLPLPVFEGNMSGHLKCIKCNMLSYISGQDECQHILSN